eukprot:Opistho-1_new@1093
MADPLDAPEGFRTSTGIGIAPRRFDREFEVTRVEAPLPPTLRRSNAEALRTPPSTTQSTYLGEIPKAVYRNPEYRKAPLSSLINYVETRKYEDVPSERLNAGAWESEKTARYQAGRRDGRIAATLRRTQSEHGQDVAHLRHAIRAGARPLVTAAVNGPPATTTGTVHRQFSDGEQACGYAAKDIPTYWSCEGFPRAWGHGPRRNPLPATPPPTDGPMVDALTFATRTSIRRVPPSFEHVPNTGLTSVTRASYVEPKARAIPAAAVYDDRQRTLETATRERSLGRSIEYQRGTYGIPEMYAATNTLYGDFGVATL